MLADMKVNETEFNTNGVSNALKNRVAFIEIDDNIREILDDYMPTLKEALPGILTEFYAHLKKWPELASMFDDPSRMDYARKGQEAHWLNLFRAKFDDDYVASVRKIGLVHSRVGLKPTRYIGAYTFTLNRLYPHAVNHYRSRFAPEKAQETAAQLIRALNQCVMIDMDMAISVYLEENKRSYDEKLNAIAHEFENQIGSIVSGVSAAAAELEASSSSLVSVAEETSGASSSVAVASEEASANVAAVSSATEQMSSSIQQVADMAEKSYQAAGRASTETEQSVLIMVELKEAIDKVSEVADLISNIAEQTNLLALNATIEAARAGEAGKGFAVVASEVKSLANETAVATEDIKMQVSEIMAKSDSAAASLEAVKVVIEENKEASQGAAKSVSEQKEAVKEIALNVEQASTGTSDITKKITHISEGASSVKDSAEGIWGAAKDLSKQGAVLSDAVNHFIGDIKSEDH